MLILALTFSHENKYKQRFTNFWHIAKFEWFVFIINVLIGLL